MIPHPPPGSTVQHIPHKKTHFSLIMTPNPLTSKFFTPQNESGKFNRPLQGVQAFTVSRVLVCENCIVYCADRIRCFPGKRRSQEEPHFTGKHTADSVQTLLTPPARLREVKTFGLDPLSSAVDKYCGATTPPRDIEPGEDTLWSILSPR